MTFGALCDLRILAQRTPHLGSDLRRWRAIFRAAPAGHERVAAFYGRDDMPRQEQIASGGIVKFQRLDEVFPNDPRSFNLLYLGSSSAPADARQLIWLARRRGAAFVWNQDGVAYPGLEGWDVERTNRPMARALHEADHVFFQSDFCKLSSDRFLGERAGPSEVLYNAVDTQVFTPGERPSNDPVLLLGGSQYQWYRVETALRAFAAVRRERPGARLIVAGALTWSRRPEAALTPLLRELDLGDSVEFTGPYVQHDGPDIMRSADLLLHTKYNDPCPGVVIEAMACGLGIVYSASGGVPELVGPDAGIGVAAPLDFEQEHPPDPEQLAGAVLEAAARRDELGEAARQRAVERFDIRPWVERHRQVFEELLS